MKRKAVAVFLCSSFAFAAALAAQAPDPAKPNPEVFTAKYVADATEQLTGRRAHMTTDIHLLAGARLSGPAVTLQIVRDETASRTTEGLAAVKALEEAPPGSVIVAALDDQKDYAIFGETLAVIAKTRGLSGFVADGAVRNLSQLKESGFPTFARGASAGSAAGHYRIAGVKVGVWCGGIEVMPGDYVVADEDGVAVAPKERAADVLALARKLQADDRELLPLIEKYGSFTKA